jgi:hypothetical protein
MHVKGLSFGIHYGDLPPRQAVKGKLSLVKQMKERADLMQMEVIS